MSLLDVNALLVGDATDADAATDADGVDKPVLDVADVVGADDGVGTAAFVALADGSGCLTVGSGPQPTDNRDVTQRQTSTQRE